MPPSLLHGTSVYGMDGTAFQTASNVVSVLRLLEQSGVTQIDCAARYPPRAPGRAETLLGEALAAAPESKSVFAIDTKVMFPSNNDKGELCLENMRKSVATSLQRLGLAKVNVLYAHAPDMKTPLDEQVQGFNEQIEWGRCKEYGVSNHSIPHLKDMLAVCEKKGLKKPSVYQGDYNIVTRGMEKELLPLLREHGMRYVGFRAAAAGFFTGNLTAGTVAGTRFDPSTNPIGGALSELFTGPELVEAFTRFKQEVDMKGLGTIEVALRWLLWHSPLHNDDGIILGASKESQLVSNIEAIKKGPLDEEMANNCENLWAAVEESRGAIL